MNRTNSTFFKELIFISTFLTTLFVSAQSKPGGTSLDVEIWLKADQLSLANNANVTSWIDQSGNNRNFNQYTANSSATPLYLTKEMNYNPALSFTSVTTNRRKLVGPTNLVQADKEYYIFYVSRTDNTVSGYKTVLQFNGTTTTYNPTVGWNGANAWFTNYSNTIITAQAPYSVNSLFLPNVAATSNTINNFYINNGTGQTYRAVVLVTSGTNPMIIGSSNYTTGNPFIGTISEIIVLSKPKGSGLPQAVELNKINSYLAVKYGISLDKSSKYYNSNNTPIWEEDANSIYNNYVFGIGRDDNTGLYQKQSTNYANNDFELFLGSTLANTNKDNQGEISSDLSYLLVGSNTTVGTTAYIKDASTTFQEGTLTSGINQRYNRTLKVKKTGTGIGRVNIKLNNNFIYTSHVIVSNSNQFIDNVTRIYPVVNNIASNILVNDGDYISFVSNLQAPGGSNLTTELWLKADELSYSNDANITTWNDLSGYNRHFSQYLTNTLPTYSTDGMNFNPTAKFGSATNTKLVGPVNITDPEKEYYVHIVSYNRSSSWAMMLTFNQQRNNGYGWANTLTSPWQYTGYNRVATNGAGKLYSISSAFVPNVSGKPAYQYINSVETIFGNNTSQEFPTSTTNRMVLGAADLGTSYNFTGEISEVIVLSAPKGSGTPNQEELRKVNSYLSLKYGINLDKTAQPIYYNSANEVIWNSNDASYTSYNNYIFGIGRDDTSGFYQKQGTNYEYAGFTLFVGNLAVLNKNNNGQISNDKSFIFLGSNNTDGYATYLADEATNVSYVGATYQNNEILQLPAGTTDITKRFSRILKVKKTGDLGTTVNLKLGNQFTYSPYILVSSDTDFKPSNTRLYPVVSGIASNIVLNDGDYISMIASNLTPGGTNLTTEIWLRGDFLSGADGTNIDTWNDATINGRDFSKYLSQTVPTMLTNGMNYNPSLAFGSTTNTKLAGPQNITRADKQYYVFYVSETNSASATAQTVFGFNQELNNSYGWINATTTNNAWTYVGGDLSGDGIGKKYGVNAVFAPNVTNDTNSEARTVIYMDGVRKDINTTRPFNVANAIMTIGTDNLTTGFPFFGKISEIIILSSDQTTNGLPEQAQVDRINSYLAVKYGITLNATAQSKYFASNSTPIWDANANVGYAVNIFGIGRDDITGLYQKQSASYDNDNVTVFVGDFKTTNSLNTAEIETNISYMLLGSNGADDIIDYKVASNPSIGLQKNIYQRHRRTLKASVTNMTQTVGIKLNKDLYYSSYVVVSKSDDFDASISANNTRFYAVNNGIAENLTIQDGEYISFIVADNNPAGLQNLRREFWLVGDNISQEDFDVELEDALTNNFDVIKWLNRADNTNNFSNPGTTPYYPMYTESSMNFHSAVTFYSLGPDDGGPTLAQNQARKLISEKDFMADPQRSYFVFYISSLDTDNASRNTDKALFSLSRRDNFGWTGNTDSHPWIRTNNSASTNAFPASANEKRTYGITINMLPNNSSSGRYLSLNGIQNTAISGSSVFNSNNSYLSKSVIANEYYDTAGTYNTNNFFGDVLEILVLSKPGVDQTLSSEELEKLNAYYALKYGITLNAVQQKYPLSESTPTNRMDVYDTSLAGYTSYAKDIFGLVRDDASDLYQKQSTSTDNNVLTIYQGDLATTNQANTSNLLANNEAIILGAKGNTTTVNEYVYNADTTYKNGYTLTDSAPDPNTGVITYERINSIFQYHYKVRATKDGVSSTTPFMLKFAPNIGQYLLVSNETVTDETVGPKFLPETTDIYRIVGGKVEGPNGNGIPIKDGDYIAFAFYKEAPGGVVDGLRMWLNAEEDQTITTNDAGEILTWTDYSGFGTVYKRRPQNNASALYAKATASTNFHPTAYFRKYQDYLITDRAAMNVAQPAKSTIYAVVNHNFATDRSYFIGFGAQTTGTNARRPSFGVYRTGEEGFGRIGSTGLTNSSAKLFNPGATTIAGFTWTRGSSITFDFDSNRQTMTHTASSAVMNGPGMLGLASSSTNYYLQGTMPEVIAYERELSDSDRNKVNSYLGLKYAITLRSRVYTSANAFSGGNFDYVFSNSGVVWKGTVAPYSGFHNNVTSVIRDDNSKLLNRQSKSTDTGDNIHMGVGESLGVDGVLGKISLDRSALTFGNNNGSFTEVNFDPNSEICGAMDSRIGNRIWLAHPENFNQEVIVRAEAEAGFPYAGAGYQVYMLIADNENDLKNYTTSTNGITSSGWKQIIPMTFVDGAHQVNYKFTKDTYFTFGAKSTGACTSCEFEGVKTLNFDRQTWPQNGSKGPSNFDLGNDFNVEVAVEDPGDASYRNYPRYSTSKSLRERRRKFNEKITTSISFKDNEGNAISSAAYFEIFDVDRVGYKYDNIEVVGFCQDGQVAPKLSYVYRYPDRSTYTTPTTRTAVAKTYGTRYSGNVGYTNQRGKIFVEFDVPVERIEIRYTTPSPRTTNYIQEVGIGPMNFYCIAPPPPPNEDGLIFMKQASYKVLLCETVDYIFRSINTNCENKEFTLEDTLPEGMTWVNNSFSADGLDLDDPNNTVVITGYGTRTLTVTGLKSPGGGGTYTMRAQAIFDLDAVAKTYENQAQMKYTQIVNGVATPRVLNSTDRLTGEETSKTIAEASAGERPKPVTIVAETSKTCFGYDNEMEVTLKINNPNTAISDMILDFSFDSSIAQYLSSQAIGLTIGNPDSEGLEDGLVSFEGFNLPAGETIVKIKFKLAGEGSYQLSAIAPYLPVDIDFSYDLSTYTDDVCIGTSLANASGEIELPFCEYCTQPPVGGAKLGSDTGVSTLKNTFSNWPSEVPNGFLVLESGKKGMVITRTRPEDIASPVKGMIIYNTVSKCISIYNGSQWKCIERACNE